MIKHTILNWYKKNRKTMRISVLVSIVIIIFSYMVANSAYPMAGEYTALKSIYDFKKFCGQQLDNVPDSILFINVCYDKQLVPYEEEGMPVGSIPITDREKLLQFLNKAKEADNYRYIFMDVLFDEEFEFFDPDEGIEFFPIRENVDAGEDSFSFGVLLRDHPKGLEVGVI